MLAVELDLTNSWGMNFGVGHSLAGGLWRWSSGARASLCIAVAGGVSARPASKGGRRPPGR